MPAEKATALVVRGSDWSETSRIATLFTREHGKVRALAKGGRRLRSNFEVAFDLLSVCNVVYIRKHSGGLDLLTEAQLVERFPALRTNLSALYAGYYVAELLSDGTQDYDPHPALFDVALETLRALDGAGLGTASAVGRFELAWLRELGYSPRLDACAACGESLRPADWVGFSFAAGGVLCPKCEPGARDRRPLSAAARSALRELAAGGTDSGPASARGEVRQVLGLAVCAVLGRRPRLLGYVDDRGTDSGGSSR